MLRMDLEGYIFGCEIFDRIIWHEIKHSLEHGQMPDFKRFDLEETLCRCTEETCCWNSTEINARLEELGILQKIEEELKMAAKEIPAVRYADGTFTVKGHGNNIHFEYVGEYANYREMDEDAKYMLVSHPMGYVCHVAHNLPEQYVLMLPKGSEYITLE